jgi:hypothetical protein
MGLVRRILPRQVRCLRSPCDFGFPAPCSRPTCPTGYLPTFRQQLDQGQSALSSAVIVSRDAASAYRRDRGLGGRGRSLTFFPRQTADLPPDRKYVFGYHPHGVIGMGAIANFATDATGFSRLFPGLNPHLLTLQSNFKLPLYRELLLALGICSVSMKSCQNILRQGLSRDGRLRVGRARLKLTLSLPWPRRPRLGSHHRRRGCSRKPQRASRNSRPHAQATKRLHQACDPARCRPRSRLLVRRERRASYLSSRLTDRALTSPPANRSSDSCATSEERDSTDCRSASKPSLALLCVSCADVPLVS